MHAAPRTPYRRKGEYRAQNRPRGAFISGAWHCDCEPRLPADHFKVKKEGANLGRWFYTCQSKKCRFFLWDDDAKPREEAAVLNNSRDEPEDWQKRKDSSSTLANTTSSHDSLPSPPSSNAKSGLKRRIDFEDDAFDWAPTGEENQELAQVIDAATTPLKFKDEHFSTPKRRKLPWVEDDDTSASAGPKQKLLTFSTKGITTPSTHTSGESSRQQGPDVTPTPARFRNADLPKGGLGQLEEEIMQIFRERKIRVDQATEQAFRQALSNYDRKVQGFVQGRDMLRLTVKAKEAKITELQHCIATLEAEREIDKAIIKSRQHVECS